MATCEALDDIKFFLMPDNIVEYLKTHDGVNLAVNWNPASSNCGYAHILHCSVVLSKLTRTCHHCGYDLLWSANDYDSKCRRHTYNNWRYDSVFVWNSDYPVPLDECFEKWEKEQKEYEGAKLMTFGKIGWG